MNTDQQPVKSPPSTGMLTYKNDNLRSGQNDAETILNTHNVNASQFGKLASYPVDARVYAQPLFVPHLTINGMQHNVVFVATENDSVYAFDADQTTSTQPLWHTHLLPSGETPLSSNDAYCSDIGGKVIGITGTPVIDAKTQTLYVVGASKKGKTLFSRLYALNITTGKQKPHSPANITASLPGNGPGSAHGQIAFNPKRENQRAALLLSQGVVYIAWGSFCDNPHYYGWLMGYNASTLKQTAIYNPEQDNGQGGIWQSGAGLAADNQGNIYLITGEGDFDLNTGGPHAGDSVLKLSTQHGLHVIDSFTPFNQVCMNWFNQDFGSGGPLLLPNASEVIAGGKEGRIYVLNRFHLGGYTSIPGACDHLSQTNVDTVVQELPANTAAGGIWGSPAYWHSAHGDFVYVSGSQDPYVKAFALTNGRLSDQPSSESTLQESKDLQPLHISGNPVVSCNGTQPGTGIVWLIDRSQGILRAYDASNLADQLYASNQNPSRDGIGQQHVIKFSVPTVYDGKVFVGTDNSLLVYGLLNP
ncbi:MAG TPA: hypothetical protein VJ761_05915 [Ktedonobacteraceae bacterium]|nr:hypothetical protein [Ktedonobacteraceae bacterium]